MRRLTARHKAHQVKPLELSELVPGKDRTNWRHSIYWKGIARNGTEAVHDCLELVDNTSACLRRWNDFTNQWTPDHIQYKMYTPPSVQRYKGYHWELQEEGRPIASFVNVTEGYLIVLGSRLFSNRNLTLEFKPTKEWKPFYAEY